MSPSPSSYRFGPFTLDVVSCRLLRDGNALPVSPRLIDLLRHLVERPSALVSKEELFAAIWPDVVVTDNALTQAISDLRHALGDAASQPTYIQTVARRGYRFIAPVTIGETSGPLASPASSAPATGGDGVRADAAPSFQAAPGEPRHVAPGLTGVGSPFPARRARESSSLDATRALLEGRWRLESLDIDAVPEAIRFFEAAIADDPSYAAAHVGLANALFWHYEATRDLNEPDTSLLQRAVAAARQAQALDPDLPDTYATLALILVSAGRGEDARAAGRRAVALDPTYWAHHFRHGHAAWGEERLRAHAQALALYPDFAFAHFQIAMVHVARGALAQAEQTLRQGIIVRDRHQARTERFPARGLHWMLGMTLLAQGDDEQAALHFEREQAAAGGRLYAREFSIAALNGLGMLALRAGDPSRAADCFRGALARYDRHARAHFGLSAALTAARESASTRPSGDHERAAADSLAAAHAATDELARAGRTTEAEMSRAVGDALTGNPDAACARLQALLDAVPPGFAGWTIPIEPAFAPLRPRQDFQQVLATLAKRAE